MRWIAVVVVTCACDSVLGLRGLDTTDAASGNVDAASTCPPIGTSPTFGPQVFPAVVSSCSDFTISETAQRVIARCDVAGTLIVSEGGLVGSLTAVPELQPDGVHQYTLTRLAPAGDELFLQVTANGSSSFARYTNSTGTWVYAATLDLGGLTLTDLSAPTAGSAGRRMLARDAGDTLYELQDQGGDVWQMVGSYTAADLGLTAGPSNLALSSDGLRFVFGPSSYFAGEDYTYYTDRPDLSMFATPQVLATAPMLPPVYLSQGCSRLYVIDNTELDYIEQ